MPAIMILGFDLEITRVMLVAILGGLIGILMMIPLRRALIVHQHGILKYPEGTACAEVLKAGASEESRAAADPAAIDNSLGGISARTIFTGFGIGLAYKALNVAFKGWRDSPGMTFGAPLIITTWLKCSGNCTSSTCPKAKPKPMNEPKVPM